MGLQVRILLYAPSENHAFEGASAAFGEIARLDAIMSDYRVDSELMRLVARAGTGPVGVSPDLFHVLSMAQQFAGWTGGTFDVTIAPLVRLWREARLTGVLPDSVALAEARARTGWQGLTLDASSQTVQLRTGMHLDLGAIAKGYAADRALEVLRGLGLHRVLIEIGGDVRAGDPPPGRRGWRVEVAHADSTHRFLHVANEAVATSGDTEQFVEIDGRRYSHVVDPRTGLGLTTRIAATVRASDGLTADALATALTLLGPERGALFLREHVPGAEALVRYVMNDGNTHSTSWIR